MSQLWLRMVQPWPDQPDRFQRLCLQQKCGKPSPPWIPIWPIVLNRSAILAVFPVVKNSAFLLVEGTALPHVLQQLLTKSVVSALKVAIVQLVTVVHRCWSCNRGRPRKSDWMGVGVKVLLWSTEVLQLSRQVFWYLIGTANPRAAEVNSLNSVKLPGCFL